MFHGCFSVRENLLLLSFLKMVGKTVLQYMLQLCEVLFTAFVTVVVCNCVSAGIVRQGIAGCDEQCELRSPPFL